VPATAATATSATTTGHKPKISITTAATPAVNSTASPNSTTATTAAAAAVVVAALLSINAPPTLERARSIDYMHSAHNSIDSATAAIRQVTSNPNSPTHARGATLSATTGNIRNSTGGTGTSTASANSSPQKQRGFLKKLTDWTKRLSTSKDDLPSVTANSGTASTLDKANAKANKKTAKADNINSKTNSGAATVVAATQPTVSVSTTTAAAASPRHEQQQQQHHHSRDHCKSIVHAGVLQAALDESIKADELRLEQAAIASAAAAKRAAELDAIPLYAHELLGANSEVRHNFHCIIIALQ
jgi:hypothetical protein